MAEEFHSGGAGVCGGNWWNPPRSTVSFSGAGSAPCSTASNIDINGGFGWSTEMGDVRQGSSEESASVSDSSNITVFPDIHRPQLPPDSSAGNDTVLTDSTLQIMTAFNLPSSASSSDWNPALLHGVGRAGNNYQSMVQQDLGPVPRLNNYNQQVGTMAAAMDISPQIQKNWSPTNLATPTTTTTTSGSGSNREIALTPHPFHRPILNLNQGFPSVDPLTNNSGDASGDCIVTFPMTSPSYAYPSPTMLESETANNLGYYANPNTSTGHQFVPSAAWPNNNSFPTATPTPSASFLKPSFPKVLQQYPTDQLHLSNKNNANFWNSNASAAGFPAFGPTPDQSLTAFFTPAFEEKPNIPTLHSKNYRTEDVRESVSAAAAAKRSSANSSCSGETLFKRPRMETPSPLPAFKVRKEKLGDRVTALQQLVSPFGKTDTASVLHEAIEYIKFLHDKVCVLSSPYMKNGPHLQHQQACEKLKEADGPKQDLRSRGLCVVPIPNTFPVADEATADFWTPTYGGPYR